MAGKTRKIIKIIVTLYII